MKTLHFKSIVLALLVVLSPVFMRAQNFEASKSVSKNAVVPGDVTIKIDNQSGDLKIVTTDEKTVQMVTSVEINANSKAEADAVIKAVDDFKFNLVGSTLIIDTRFYKNIMSVNNRQTMTLLSGEKVKIKEFKVRHELRIPKTANLDLNNKYSEIELGSLDGEAEFTLYSSTLHAAGFSKDFSMEAKYSKVYLDNIQQKTEINFYDTDMEFTSCKDAKIISKYSKLTGEKTGNLVIESYDDNFDIKELSGLNMNAKYSDFVSRGNINELQLELYDCNIQLNSVKKGSYTGKYSELKLGDVKELNVAESYDDDFYLRKTEKIKIAESKYGKYELDETESFYLNGYDDNITIRGLKKDFSEVSLFGKYGKLNIDAGSEPFQVDFKIKYPKVDIPESVKVVKQIKENSDLELVGGTSGGKIKVEGYDMKVVITD